VVSGLGDHALRFVCSREESGDAMSQAAEVTCPLDEVLGPIVERLRPRMTEIEQAIYVRIREAVPDAVGDGNTDYQSGLLTALGAALRYAMEAIEHGPPWSDPIPLEVAVQARRAVQAGVSLSIVQRRYIAGHGKLGELISEEIARETPVGDGQLLHHLRIRQESLLEYLLAEIEREYFEETQRSENCPKHRRRQIVLRLLAGDPADVAELRYEIHSAWHLGMIASGAKVEEVLDGLARHMGCALLLVRGADDWTFWAWLGAPRQLYAQDAERVLLANDTTGLMVTVGEPGRGLRAFSLSHRQARAALAVASRRPKTVTRCADVALEAAVLGDEALLEVLQETYISPLNALRIGMPVACETLRHYFRCASNVSSAANSLGVTRPTVKDRLKQIEKALGRPLEMCQAELEVVLRIEAHESACPPKSLSRDT
jgi:PucR-like helix-turn-helix protein